jgi:2,4-dienoyl-CoA reductase-like NADH-dependent reductase (Old Yellow Enzyme family)
MVCAGAARLGVAGKIMSGADVAHCLDAGADFVLLGRAAILHHDFPQRMRADPAFASVPRPVTRDYLRGKGLSEPFVDYMASWPDFVEG